LSRLVQGLLARGPSAGCELLGLKSLDDAKDLVHVTSYAKVVHGYPTNCA
jgi:hypothetical protein